MVHRSKLHYRDILFVSKEQKITAVEKGGWGLEVLKRNISKGPVSRPFTLVV